MPLGADQSVRGGGDGETNELERSEVGAGGTVDWLEIPRSTEVARGSWWLKRGELGPSDE